MLSGLRAQPRAIIHQTRSEVLRGPMDIHITPITDPTTAATPCLVLPVSGTGPGNAEQALDQACGGLLATLRQRGDLPAKTGDLLLLPTVRSEERRVGEAGER